MTPTTRRPKRQRVYCLWLFLTMCILFYAVASHDDSTNTTSMTSVWSDDAMGPKYVHCKFTTPSSSVEYEEVQKSTGAARRLGGNPCPSQRGRRLTEATEGNSTSPQLEKEKSLLDLKQQTALELFYNETGMWKPESNHDWFDDKYDLGNGTYDFCSFKGVKCKYQRKNYMLDGNEEDSALPAVVVEIHLKKKRLSGSLPSSVFSALPRLESLILSSNSLQGTIPQSLMDLGELRRVDLAKNQLDGPFPVFNSTKAKLSGLMLQQNRLRGTISSEALCPFDRLKALDISGNHKLNGTLPECMGTLEDLYTLKLDEASLTGSIPSGLCGPSRQRMNGLEPNVFGCDAIACPLGSFEKSKGRQRDQNTTCRPCSTAIVLGAKTCPEAPSLPTLPVPSLRPSISPSEEPSFHPTSEKDAPPSNPSVSPSQSVITTLRPPASGPSFTMTPSSQPTNVSSDIMSPAPTMSTFEANVTLSPTDDAQTRETISLEIVLFNVSRLLTTDDEIQMMEVIVEFLQLHQGGESTDPPVSIVRATLVGQRLQTGSDVQTKDGDAIISLQLPRNIRLLQSEYSRSALAMTVDVVIGSLITWDGNENDLVAEWDENKSDLVQLVQDAFRQSTLFDAPTREGSEEPSATPNGAIDQPNRKSPGKGNKLAMLWAALVLSFMAVISAALLHFSCWRTRNERYKRQGDTGPMPGRASSNDSATTTPPARSSSNNDDMLEEIIDSRSTFSCWKHWDNIKCAVSEESDSGWNSGSGSGSVPDSSLHSYLMGEKNARATSISGASLRSNSLLDTYHTEEWSVAPDQHLCFSASGGSDGNGEMNETSGIPVIKTANQDLSKVQGASW